VKNRKIHHSLFTAYPNCDFSGKGCTAKDSKAWAARLPVASRYSQVQKYSDRELFWVVKSGIRFRATAAFGIGAER
jgi:hypothetical protein